MARDSFVGNFEDLFLSGMEMEWMNFSTFLSGMEMGQMYFSPPSDFNISVPGLFNIYFCPRFVTLLSTEGEGAAGRSGQFFIPDK